MSSDLTSEMNFQFIQLFSFPKAESLKSMESVALAQTGVSSKTTDQIELSLATESSKHHHFIKYDALLSTRIHI